MHDLKTPARGFFLFCAALFGYLLVAPIYKPWAELGWHDSQRILQIALLVLTALLFLASSRLAGPLIGLYRQIDVRTRYALAAMLIWALASSLSATLPRMALLETAYYFLLLHAALCVAACRAVLGAVFDRLALAALVLFGVFYSTAVIAALATAYSGVGLDVWSLFNGNGFDNPRFFGQAQTLSFPVFGALLLVLKKPAHRFALLGLLAFWWTMSIAAGTRGTWLAMAVAIGVAPLMGRTGRDWARWQVLALVVGGVLYGGLFVMPNWQDGSVLVNRLPALTHLSAREVIWGRAWESIVSHPWLGIGPMHFALRPNGVGAHPHNAILQWAAEMGVPFALLAIGVIFASYRRLLRQVRVEADATSQVLLVGLFLSLLAGAAQAMVDGVVVMPYSQTLIVLLAGWAIGLCMRPNDASAVAHHGLPSFRMAYSLLLAAALFALAYGVYPELFNLVERDDAYGHLAPRFWRLGWLEW